MEFGKKLFELRKQKNLSQEQLAEKMGVARQTISKWELGETSPDLKQAKELSKIFNVSLDELVGNNIQEIMSQKISNTEKLAGLILKLIKIFGIAFTSFIILFILLVILFRVNKNNETKVLREESIICTIYNEEHSFDIKYDELTGRPIELGGDAYFSDILDLDKYNDAHQIFNVINDYVKRNGGTCYMEGTNS
ncbi:MAG: helix-turn-helix transcriptional regulator [Bacilli bacterium]|nr:helix-turn-helix transcriptional regulator [Bacilli bacterium]